MRALLLINAIAMKMKLSAELKSFAIALFSGLPLLAAGESDSIRVAGKVEGGAEARPLYVANRSPLAPSPFIKLPIGSITPKGWLRHQLELEADGMTGHLEEISKWCTFDGNAWSDPTGAGHSG